MEIKALSKDISAIKEILNGKKRIYAYGAGNLAADINKLLKSYGYQIDAYIVDEGYLKNEVPLDDAGNANVILMHDFLLRYAPESDVLFWAIGSPEKLQACIKAHNCPLTCYLIWEYLGFWKDKDYLTVHKDEFLAASTLLYDEYSKKVFWGYLDALKGNIYDDISLSASGTYFNELTRRKKEGAFVDCGAYDGDSVINYFDFFNDQPIVYAFEPDRANFEKLMKKTKGKANVFCINKGCYSAEGHLSFSSSGDMSSSLQETGNDSVEVTTIDSTVDETKVSFIKMDIEGTELEGLKGAKHVIERDMSVLAVSTYHRQEDLITLIPYIAGLHSKGEKYNLYLRHHGITQTELVLYAIPAKI